MRRALLTTALLLAMPALMAQDSQKTQAVALVKDAVKTLKAFGKDKLIRETNFAGGRFHAKGGRDLYIFVFDTKGNALAHGFQSNMVNINRWDARDPEGMYFVREFIKIAEAKGSGWVDYKYLNPGNQKLGFKSSYIEMAEGLVIGCGFYQ